MHTHISARKLLKTIRRVPEWLLSEDLRHLKTEADLAIKRHWKNLYAVFTALLTASCIGGAIEFGVSHSVHYSMLTGLFCFALAGMTFTVLFDWLTFHIKIDQADSAELEDICDLLELDHLPDLFSGNESRVKDECLRLIAQLAYNVVDFERLVEELKRRDSDSHTIEIYTNLLEGERDYFNSYFRLMTHCGLIKVEKARLFPKPKESQIA